MFETLLSICVGLGLAASCGFRVFLPCLLAGLGRRYGIDLVDTLPGFLASTPALIALSAASMLEIGGYYVPWFDNLLDTVASPVAVLAGILLFAGVAAELDPVWRWSLAVMAGGGAAATTQTATVLTRGFSSGTTGGLGNPIVSTMEWVLAALTSVLALLLPPLVLAAVVASVWWLFRARRSQRAAVQQPEASGSEAANSLPVDSA